MLTQLQLGRDFFLRQEIAFSPITMPLAPSDPLTTTNISFLVVNVTANVGAQFSLAYSKFILL